MRSLRCTGSMFKHGMSYNRRTENVFVIPAIKRGLGSCKLGSHYTGQPGACARSDVCTNLKQRFSKSRHMFSAVVLLLMCKCVCSLFSVLRDCVSPILSRLAAGVAIDPVIGHPATRCFAC